MYSSDLSERNPQLLYGEPETKLLDDRLWVDGCFDFFHHGHAGAMVQARQLGNELYVGVHSDEDILANKGPTVMTLEERLAATNACRWVTKSIGCAPYVTDIAWITHFGCKYVVHGDDLTSDREGNDCYRFVKEAGRFKIVKRSPGISTTDLVGRMLLCTKTHFIHSLRETLLGKGSYGSAEERKAEAGAMVDRLTLYATDETAKAPGVDVRLWLGSRSTGLIKEHTGGFFENLIRGPDPEQGQRVVYVDGGFDLFSSGHIEFLRHVMLEEKKLARERGWFTDAAISQRRRGRNEGHNYEPAYVVVGLHDDGMINHWKGLNYPIMNIFERGLCVLQCKYVNAVIFGAPFAPSTDYLSSFPWGGEPQAVYHGQTAFMALPYDAYAVPKSMGIYRQIGAHAFPDVNAGQIVQRILSSRDKYEARQRSKADKTEKEAWTQQ